MKYKVLLLALAAITTSCSPQADINYHRFPTPQQTMIICRCFGIPGACTAVMAIGLGEQKTIADWPVRIDNDADGKPKGIRLVALQCQ